MCSKIDSEARCSHFLTTYAFYVPTVCFHYSWSRQPPFRFKKLEVNGSFGIIEDWSQLLMDGNIRYVLHSQLNTFSTPVIALLHIIPSLYWCLFISTRVYQNAGAIRYYEWKRVLQFAHALFYLRSIPKSYIIRRLSFLFCSWFCRRDPKIAIFKILF